jgi:hypothetical protein
MQTSFPALKSLPLVLMIMAAALLRLPNAAQLTAFSNFTPIGAMALFGGAYLRPAWKAIAFPLATLLISDLLINILIFQGKYGIMYSGWFWIYGIFGIIVCLGRLLLNKVAPLKLLLTATTASLTHWLIADATVWLGGGIDLRTMLPLSKDWSGLMQCYIQGFPFFKNFLLGTIAYSGIMFGLYEWMRQHKTQWVTAKERNY